MLVADGSWRASVLKGCQQLLPPEASFSTHVVPGRFGRGSGNNHSMRRSLMIGVCATLLVGVTGAAEKSPAEWRTYRNGKFGYEISYPAEMEHKEYVDGSSGELKAARTGETLVNFEVWPPGECPRQPPDTSAREVGIERAKTVTQADGPDRSSSCGDPVAVRTYESRHGAKIYELELTCSRETYPGGHGDTDDAESDAAPTDGQHSLTVEGTKGPTYFVDISPPWQKRILTADPVGVDSRLQQAKQKIDLAVLRKILGTLRTFPIPKPLGVCIGDFQNRSLSIGHPSR